MAFTAVAVAALAISVAATAYTAVTTAENNDALEAQYKQEAKTQQAAEAQEEAIQRRNLQRTIAAQDALRAGRGTSLTSGTALSIYDDTLNQGAKDIAAAKFVNANQVQRYRYAAAGASQASQNAAIGGGLAAAGQAAGGTYSIYRQDKATA